MSRSQVLQGHFYPLGMCIELYRCGDSVLRQLLEKNQIVARINRVTLPVGGQPLIVPVLDIGLC